MCITYGMHLLAMRELSGDLAPLGVVEASIFCKYTDSIKEPIVGVQRARLPGEEQGELF